MTRAAEWRRVGRDMAARFVANAETYAQAGITDPDAYRVAFVRECWPRVGEHIRRQIRAGWREVIA